MKNIYTIENYVRFNDEWEEIFTLDCNYKYLLQKKQKPLKILSARHATRLRNCANR